MENEQNTSPFQYINNEDEKIFTGEIKEEVKIDAKKAEDFVTGLPDWDLTPPYEIIRRVNRK